MPTSGERGMPGETATCDAMAMHDPTNRATVTETGLVKATGQRFTLLPVENPIGFFFEAVVPVEDPDLQFRIDEILEVLLADDSLAWKLGPGIDWKRVPSEIGVDAHITLRALAEARAARES